MFPSISQSLWRQTQCVTSYVANQIRILWKTFDSRTYLNKLDDIKHGKFKRNQNILTYEYILQAVVRLKKVSIFESRRNQLQILSDILELCKMPQAKTYILRNTNTNFKLLESYLLQLQTSYLLETQRETQKYFTTKEGQEFIETWIKLKTILYPQKFPFLTKNKKCFKRNNQFIAIPTDNTNYLTIKKIDE